VPGRLKRLNYIFLRGSAEEKAGLRQLSQALLTDIAWVREHTRLGGVAADWERAQRAPELFLRGGVLAAAELWVSQQHAGDQRPTELQRAFITASREAEQARAEAERAQVTRTQRFQRRAAWALAGLGLFLAAALAGTLWQTRETAKREALVLTSAAQKALDDGYYQRAARIALLGLPKRLSLPFLTPWSHELAAKLEATQIFGGNFKARFRNGHLGGGTAFSPDG
jgi:hypothetical protein